MGPEIGGFYAPLDWLSIGAATTFALRPGVTGTGGSDGQRTEEHRQFWHGAAQARFHPFAFAAIMPWAGIELGISAVQTITETSGSTTGSNGTSTDTSSAPTFGAGAGLDVWVHESVSVTLQGWLLHIGLEQGAVGSTSPTPRTYYSSPFWASLGVGARLWF
jgi:opacity protein-like surface antigen